MARPLKIMMLGLRGFPGVQGGVETHAERLCPLLVDAGCDVTVLVRAPYQPAEVGPIWKGVKFIPLWAPKSKRLEAIIHSFLGVLYAAIKRPDILHIQAIGPAVMTPLARLLGLRVVVTHHGPDYDREKWGRFARVVLQVGERWGMRYSNERIVISKVIADIVHSKHRKKSVLIPNGVVLPQLPNSTETLEKFGLHPGRYILMVSRLVPEKRHFDLIEAFTKLQPGEWKLVFVGGSDHPDSYMQALLLKINKTPNAIFTGFQSGKALQELYGHAGLFVLPSSHEGLPIAMLEALSYGLPVVASDIPANLEIGLEKKHYFPLGDADALSNQLQFFIDNDWAAYDKNAARTFVDKRYNWQGIARQTIDVFKTICSDA
ncbi:glycosyltransferase family 4 protein [Methylomicrobium lacus]|uniref:glycosyltransferase family 4 protein n=1 Tax=Methylomicrobium lacus TaxID=136992 RepID=UPI0035A913EA